MKSNLHGIKFGWKRDLPDLRDFRYSAHPEMKEAVSLPSEMDLRPHCPAIKDQGQMGSCVSNGTSFALEYLQMLALKAQNLKAPEVFGPEFSDISRLFIYYNCRVVEDTVSQDDGTQIRTAIKVIRNHGICQETLWPYLQDSLFLKPIQNSYDEAKHHLVLAGYRVNSSKLNSIKTCLAAGFPIVFGTSLYSSFMDVGSDGIVPMPEATEEMQGGHCMTIVGYQDDMNACIVANSWGTGFGDQGYVYMPYEYLTSFYLSSDFWTIRQEKA